MTDFVEQTFKRLVRALAPRSGRRNVELRREIEEEIRFHIEMRAEDLLRRGIPHEEAMARARRAFGDERNIRDRCLFARENDPVRRGTLQTISAIQFAAGAALIMSVLFLAWSVLVREPLTFPAGGEWVLVGQSSPESEGYQSNTTLNHFDRIRDRSDLFDRMTAARYVRGTLTGNGPPTGVRIKEVTPNYFDDHGVRPGAGALRLSGADNPVVLSHNLFHVRYRGDPSVFGESLDIDGRRHTMVGAVPESFQMFSDTDLFRPIPEDRVDRLADEHFLLSARLRSHVSPDEAGRRLADEPAADASRHTIVRTINSVYSSSVRPRVWLFLIVCGLIGLAVAVPAARRPESRGPVYLVGAAAGSAVLTPFVAGLMKPVILGQYGRLFDTAPGVQQWLLFAAGALLLMLTLSGSRGLFRSAVRPPGRRPATARSASGGFTLSAQIAIGIFVVSLAAQTIADQWRLERVEFGFDGTVYVSTLHLGAVDRTRIRHVDALGLFFEYLESSDGVTSASLASVLPGTSQGADRTTLRPLAESDKARPTSDPADGPTSLSTGVSALLLRVGTDYFGTMGLNMIEGGDFRSLADGAAPFSIVVNRPLAERLWPDTTAVGRAVHLSGLDDPLHVAGVVESHLLRGAESLDEPTAYVIAWRFFPSSHHILVHSSASPQSIARVLREAAERVDPNIAITPLSRAGDAFMRDLRTARLQTSALLLLALLSLVLCVTAAVRFVGNMVPTVMDRVGSVNTSDRNVGVRTILLRPTLLTVLPGLLVGIAVTCCARHVLPGPLASIAAPELWVLLPAVVFILGAIATAATPQLRELRLLTSV